MPPIWQLALFVLTAVINRMRTGWLSGDDDLAQTILGEEKSIAAELTQHILDLAIAVDLH